MVKCLFRKFGGVIFFYLAIVGMITIINYRFRTMSIESEDTLAVVTK